MIQPLSPLRYPGGKGRLADFFKQVLKDNRLLDGVYVEPYAGGAAVALSLLFDEYVSRIIINDKDRSIYAFWHSVLHHTEQLCQLIEETPVTLETRLEQKARQQRENKENEDLLALGFSTLFLNRVNRSGIIKGGVIGGNDQTGNYKIDARYNKADLIERIERIASYSDRISLYNEDAITLLGLLKGQLPSEKSIIYLDPPYYKKGQGLYMNYYRKSDHQQIRDAIAAEKDVRWIVSYDNAEPIKELYKDFRSEEFMLNYSASHATGRGTEVMFVADNCILTPHAIDILQKK